MRHLTILAVSIVLSCFCPSTGRGETRMVNWKVCRHGEHLTVARRCDGAPLSASALTHYGKQSCAAGHKGLEGKKGEQGAAGDRGDEGPQGSLGAGGIPLFGALPSDESVKGFIRKQYDFSPTTHTDFFQALGIFSNPASEALTSEDIVIVHEASSGITSESTLCTGNSQSPTASIGKLCIYVAEALNAANFSTFTLGKIGFGLNWKVSEPGMTFVQAGWAYHAK